MCISKSLFTKCEKRGWSWHFLIFAGCEIHEIEYVTNSNEKLCSRHFWQSWVCLSLCFWSVLTLWECFGQRVKELAHLPTFLTVSSRVPRSSRHRHPSMHIFSCSMNWEDSFLFDGVFVLLRCLVFLRVFSPSLSDFHYIGEFEMFATFKPFHDMIENVFICIDLLIENA